VLSSVLTIIADDVSCWSKEGVMYVSCDVISAVRTVERDVGWAGVFEARVSQLLPQMRQEATAYEEC
jgi:hypothetical protein